MPETIIKMDKVGMKNGIQPKYFLADDLAVPASQDFVEEIKTRFQLERDVMQADGILTFGGDGTMLRTIHKYEKLQCPFIGIGFGTVNFLMNDIKTDDQKIKLKKILFGDVKPDIIEVSTINVLFYKNGVLIKKAMAVNDIVIGNDLMSWIGFEVKDEESVFGKFEGSGFCIATSTGSTGWNKNNGGQILPLNSTNWTASGLGTTRRISEVIDAQELIISFTHSREKICAWVDGKGNKVNGFDTILLEPGTVSVKLGFFDKLEYRLKRRGH